MFRVSSVALLSALLLMSGCLKKDGGWTSGKSGSGTSQLDSYCHCPAKNGTVGVTHFEFDSSEVLPEAMQLMDEYVAKCLASRLKENSEVKVLVTGHADKRGTQEYNLALGSRRADATSKYLVSSVLKQLNSAEPEAEAEAEDAYDATQQLGEGSDTVQKTLSEDDVRSRFCINSKGKAELVDNGNTEEAHAKNRRTVIDFVQECN